MHGDASSPAEPAARPGRVAVVLGATGVVGHFLLPRLAAAGWEVHAVSRREPPAGSPPHVRWHHQDIAGGLDWLPTDASALFHAAPLWLLPPLVADLVARGARRIVAFGSTSRFAKSESALGRALARAEEELAAACGASGVPWTVFRPTLIYGAGLDRNVSTIARVAQRFGVFPLAGAARGLRQPVHADDLALACLQAVDEPRTFGRAYDLTGGSTLTYREMVEQVFTALGRRPRTPRVPVAALRAGLRLAALLPRLRYLQPEMADRMAGDQAFDSADARRDFGYAPRPFDAAAVVEGTLRRT